MLEKTSGEFFSYNCIIISCHSGIAAAEKTADIISVDLTACRCCDILEKTKLSLIFRKGGDLCYSAKSQAASPLQTRK